MSIQSIGFGNMPASDEKVYSDDEYVSLRVGGKRFETAVGTLRKYPECKLAALFSEDVPTKVPSDKEFSFDR